jgi:hypothetical protein
LDERTDAEEKQMEHSPKFIKLSLDTDGNSGVSLDCLTTLALVERALTIGKFIFRLTQ